MKIFTQSVYFLCGNREDLCSCLRKYFLCFSKCVVASRSIFVFFNEQAAASEKILTTASEGKCAAYVFFVCGCFYKHFKVF